MAAFACPLCRASVSVPADPAAKHAICAKCQLRIPRARWPVAVAPAPEPQRTPPPPSDEPARRKVKAVPAREVPALPPVAETPAIQAIPRAQTENHPEPDLKPVLLPPPPEEEKSAFLQALLSLIALHGKPTPQELAVLKEYAREFKVKIRTPDLRQYSLTNIAQRVRERDERERLLAAMLRMAKADAPINDEEKALIQFLSARWGVPVAELGDAREMPEEVRRRTERKVQALAREAIAAEDSAGKALAEVVEEGPGNLLEQVPWLCFAAGAAELALIVFAWMCRGAFGAGWFVSAVQTLDLLFTLLTLAGSVALVLFFRYGLSPSRSGAQRATWGVHLAGASLVLILLLPV